MTSELYRKLIKNINTNILSGIFTCLALAAIVYLIYVFVPQELNINLINSNFFVSLEHFVPEQAERASYITSVLLIIPIFVCFYLFFSNKKSIVNSLTFLNKFNDITSLSCLLFLMIVAIVSVYFYSYFTLIPCIFLACVLFYYKDKNILKSKKLTVVYISLSIIFIARVLFLYLSKQITDTSFEQSHFSAFAYPIFKVENGLTLNVDFNNIYGYYPYFYLLFSKIFGVWTINKILYFNIFLLVCCWLIMGFVINKFIKNKMLASIIFVLFVYLTGGQGDYYLQTFPLRLINFAFVWFLSACLLFTRGKNQNVLLFIGFTGLCLGIIWNSESGLISLIAWTAFLIYRQALIDTVKSKSFYKKSLIFILCFTITLLFFALICYLIPYFRTKGNINLQDLFFGMSLFYKSGFYMLRIAPYHPWFVPLIIYFIALIIVINPVLQFKKSNKPFLPFLFLTALIGFGFYIYYQGRSHIHCLIGVLFPLILIIGFFIDRLPKAIKVFTFNKNYTTFCLSLKVWNFILCIVTFTCFFFAYLNIFTAKNEIDENSLYNSHKEFFESLKYEKNVLIIANGNLILYEIIGVKDNFPFPSTEDLILKKDYEKILTYLENNNNSVMFTDYWLKQFEEYDLPRLNKILNKREKIIDSPIIFFRYQGE